MNAESGALIWSYSSGVLQHSVLGDIRALDLDRNGSIALLNFGDFSGNTWRADLNVDAADGSVIVSHRDILDSTQLVFNAPSNFTKDGCHQPADFRVGKKVYATN